MISVTDPYYVEKVAKRLMELWSEALLSAMKDDCRTCPPLGIPGVEIKAIEDGPQKWEKDND